MKKEYIKPLMESEMFVSNEYIATCWKITCSPKGLQDLGQNHTDCKDHYTIVVSDKRPATTGGLGLLGDNWWSGKINGKDTLHPVIIEDITTEIHPNAS